MKPDVCPQCGTLVPDDAKACPECGSDESTGWSDSARAEQLGIPAEDFNYEEFVEEELSPKKKSTGLPFYWWIAAVLVLAAFLFMALRLR
ncbi:MAG TPA: zinc-ribbon domain-containing protein [Roseimicrobium sp.]|nr:zinc-ribbon domain-containing protein [Roseimicrobium sp.]